MERVEYIKPSIDIVKIYSQTILSGSDPESVVELPGGGTEYGGPSFGGSDGDGNDF